MNPSDLDRALSAMGTEVDATESSERADARRRRVVAHMQRVNAEFASAAQRTRWRRWVIAAGLPAATAAAAAIALFSLRSESVQGAVPDGAVQAAGRSPVFVPLRSEMTQGSVLHRMNGGVQSLGLGDSPVLGVADAIETQDGSRARLHGGRGLDIELGPASRLVLGEIQDETGATRLRLEHGRVSCSVDPTGEGPKLAVVTPDAIVEVKGTVFSVELLGQADDLRTCVRVQRGLVSVKRGAVVEGLGAGQSSGCAAQVSDLEVEEELGEGEAESAAASTSPPDRTSSEESTLPQLSSLPTQNGLFARGLAAERRGELVSAERTLRQLLSQYPETPLRPDVEAALERIVARRELR